MNSIKNKITSTGKAVVKDLKGFANKYVPFYKKQAAIEEKESSITPKEPTSSTYRDYSDTDVNQGSMSLPGF